MTVLEVKDKSDARAFLDLPRRLYKDDPDWICPLDNDIITVFDPQRNSFFSHGSCTRWLLKNESGEIIGRVAAFINNHKAYEEEKPTGGMGFFDCINDQSAAFLLFDTAKNWLKERGMQVMEGPVNFGENDKYWGLLVDGFKPPSMGMNYNPPWYQSFFESYGFVKKYDQLTNMLDLNIPFPERFLKIANWVLKKPEYSFRHFDKKEFDRFAADFREIYNDAWSDFPAFSPMEQETVYDAFMQMKPVMDEKIIWFAYHQDEPIGFIICMPDINPVLRHLNGKLNWWGKLKFLWYKNRIITRRIRTIVMGCKKKYQNRGIESALIRQLQLEVMPRNTINGVELAWVGDFNTKMLAIHEATGAVKDKVHRTYRCDIG
ncbi:MAG: GNAT family N-acetyltransferase [Chitinophagales bacterium]|nr:GNAT family N-acetyltransferase [Chitinophagales bacterium]